ncbi:hypothetical protein D3C85_1542660 [compost metagenome]
MQRGFARQLAVLCQQRSDDAGVLWRDGIVLQRRTTCASLMSGDIQSVFHRESQVALAEDKLLNVTIALINWLHD